MTNAVCVLFVKEVQYPGPTVGPRGLLATKYQVTQMLVCESCSVFGHHEEEYLLWVKSVKLPIPVRHTDVTVNSSFLLNPKIHINPYELMLPKSSEIIALLFRP